MLTGVPPVQRRPETVPFPGPLRGRDQGELDRRAIDPAGRGGTARLQRGPRPPRLTTATGISCTWSAPTSAATAASGNRVYGTAARPAESASARNWASIVPASQYTCR